MIPTQPSASVSTSAINPEVQLAVTCSHMPLPTPMAAISHSPRVAPAAELATNPIDDFFGYTLSSSHTHESRHDHSVADILPPYVEESDLPAYTPYAEHITLAMYLFKFGFLFPPFWIFGALILVSPLREPPASPVSPAWMPEKTETERQEIISQMRKVEVKWAWRCLYALVIFAIICCGVGIGIWAYLKH